MTQVPLPPPYSHGPWPGLGVPSLPRLALEPTRSHGGMFDGAWWPRSTNLRAELPDLITALSVHLGPILRVGLDTVTWGAVPREVAANGRLVKVGWLTTSDDTISLTTDAEDHVLLLVVPPCTEPRIAAAALAAAARTGNHASAAELLAWSDLDSQDSPDSPDSRAAKD
ncbi:hypothetical protein ABH930_004750 [Kitasatospora sp. GAS204A]|uniref:DUF5994 family protein n=1 Tax=unclassified Kitasatospora TaxID=2633591 RepID=UPI00247436F8|nr:DUF5994 family protein [Kitasatospora sp. GAS204B]MDH6120355.1 hypothetical protein [Kitasatospora sp. GAS204B]